jgi:outer membrane lipoprotein-sorting protein
MNRKAASYIASVLLVAVFGGWVWLRRPAPVAAEPDAAHILSYAMACCYGLNRVGEQTTVVISGDKRVTTRVELAYRRPGMTRLRYLDGKLAGVEVWEDRDRVYRYLPDKKVLEVTPAAPSRPQRLQQRLRLVRQNYTASLEGSDTVAGRRALRIVLRPRHPGNPWKRMWVDAESYLMLGSEDYTSDNRLMRSTRFTRVSYRTEPESFFKPRPELLKRVSWNPSADESPRPPAQIERKVGFPILLPRYVPPGYQLRGSFVVPCQCGCGEGTVRSQYSDGLNMISVFQCGHPCAHGGTCMVAGAPQGAAVRLTRGKDTFLFVSDLARSELEKMARSLPPREPEQTVSRR